MNGEEPFDFSRVERERAVLVRTVDSDDARLVEVLIEPSGERTVVGFTDHFESAEAALAWADSVG